MKPNLLIAAALVCAAVLGLVLFFVLGNGERPDTPEPEPTETILPRQTRPVFPTGALPSVEEPDPVRVEAPAPLDQSDQRLLRLLVEGSVEDGRGIGIVDARVDFTGQHALAGMHGTGYTDGSGRYRFVAWSTQVVLRTTSTERRGVISAQTPDGGLAVSDSVLAPDDVLIMPPLRVAAGAVLQGQVAAPDGLPAAGAAVTIQSSLPLQIPELSSRQPHIATRPLVKLTRADESGRFRFARLPAGTYRVTGDPGYFGMNTDAAIITLDESGEAFARVELRAQNYVRGQVVDPFGEPVAGARVSIFATAFDDDVPEGVLRPVPVMPRPEPSEIRRFEEEEPGSAQQLTDAFGRFGFFALQDMRYTVVAGLGQARASVTDARINQPDLRLLLEPEHDGVVSGMARDAETGRVLEAFDARVFQAGTAEPAGPFLRVAENRHFPLRPGGAFRVIGVPAGDYVLRISAPGYLPALLPMRDFNAGEHRSGLSAELQPLCEVTIAPTHEGRRYDLEPVMLLHGNSLAYRASTDSAGQVRIPGVAPGSYELRLVLANGQIMTARVEVPARRTAALEAELAPGN